MNKAQRQKLIGFLRNINWVSNIKFETPNSIRFTHNYQTPKK